MKLLVTMEERRPFKSVFTGSRKLTNVIKQKMKSNYQKYRLWNIRIYIPFAIFLIFGPGHVYACLPSDCELKKDSDNIYIYSCKTTNSNYNAIRAEFEINATVSQYAEILLNVAQYHKWHYRERHQKILKKISASEMIYHTEVITPWPFVDRDMVLHFKMTQDPKTKMLTVTLKSIPDYIPEQDNIVRVPKSYSILTAMPISENRLKINYFVEADPGGALPAGVVNKFSAQGPWETFSKLRKMTASIDNPCKNASFVSDK